MALEWKVVELPRMDIFRIITMLVSDLLNRIYMNDEFEEVDFL